MYFLFFHERTFQLYLSGSELILGLFQYVIAPRPVLIIFPVSCFGFEPHVLISFPQELLLSFLNMANTTVAVGQSLWENTTHRQSRLPLAHSR